MQKPAKTDWDALAAMTDEDIDYSDIPPLPEAFFTHAHIWRPQPKVKVTVEMDAYILEWFKTAAADWQSRMQTALRLYVETHQAYQQH